jgi:hypothetical protein
MAQQFVMKFTPNPNAHTTPASRPMVNVIEGVVYIDWVLIEPLEVLKSLNVPAGTVPQIVNTHVARIITSLDGLMSMRDQATEIIKNIQAAQGGVAPKTPTQQGSN